MPFREAAYPIGFRVFPDGLYVAEVTPAHVNTIGARLVAINGVPATEVRRRMAENVPRENNASEMAELPGWLSMADAPQAEGIAN
jgi:hypothetical protein